MELRQYVTIVRKYLWVIVLTTLLAGGVSYYIAKTTTPTYSATVTLQIDLVNDPRNDITQSLTAGGMLAKTYIELIRSPEMLVQVASAVGLPDTPAVIRQLSGMVMVSQVRDTQLIKVAAENADPGLAQRLANTLAQVFIDQNAAKQQARYESSKQDLDQQIAGLEGHIREIQTSIASLGDPLDPKNANMPEFTRVELTRQQTDLASYQTRYTILLNSAEEFRLAAARYSDRVSVLAPARLPDRPSKPNKTQYMLLGLSLGLTLGTVIAFLREYLDDTIKTSEDVTQAVGVVTLGNIFCIPHIKAVKDALVAALDPRSVVVEGYRTLRTNLQFCGLGGQKGGILLVTSAGPTEGKSTTAANLAIVLAQSGKRVILVDSDLRRPSQHRLFGVEDEIGLTDLLVQSGPIAGECYRPTTVENLWVIPCGSVPPNPAELLGSSRMADVLCQLQAQADLVILDSPPALAVTDASVLASRVSGVLLVIDAGGTRRDATVKAKETLEKAGGKLLGAVLNKQRAALDRGSYYNYYYNGKDGHNNGRGRK